MGYDTKFLFLTIQIVVDLNFLSSFVFFLLEEVGGQGLKSYTGADALYHQAMLPPANDAYLNSHK
jgi:hypothetical protein